MTSSLYWYDYETFGLNPSRDHISQFAGIRTNEKLEIVSEPLVMYCHPPSHRLPSPESCLVTGITPQVCLTQGIPEREFIDKIYRELSFPKTCGVGYNNINFDDEFTRYCLYRNFYDPYAREHQNGNSRWDILNLLRLTRALRPEGINWPVKDDGSPCFKLVSLTEANGIDHESAHDALSDVIATINLAKLVMTKQPKLYNYIYAHRLKKEVKSLIDTDKKRPFLHVSGKLHKENLYSSLMMPLTINPTNNNSIICFNLMGDPKPLIDFSATELYENLFVNKSNKQELSLYTIELNKCPIILTPKLIDDAASNRLNISLEKCNKNLHELLKHDLSEKLKKAFFMCQFEKSKYLERSSHVCFIEAKYDQKNLKKVRNSSSTELADITTDFQDKSYKALLFLYRATNYPDSLTVSEKKTWRNMRNERLNNDIEDPLSKRNYLLKINQLLSSKDCSERDRNILLSLKSWGDEILN
jgi:exodeoxyribonuclease-1